ncbi:hypothetical protein LVO79_21445 (plasmid) [Roseivivax marinus]|uniref:hypothetical protein n=1 Tax=Roseivivax marinus TaxID=1379903 RepID=UPI001F046147|nr:hypothetical protein [Roseivivax marinus]UMA67416.1 hypothetical protein LVO79_21445 [Roseivivax marinus]
MDPVRTGVIGVAMISLAAPALGQSLPNDVQGSWDVSPEECRATGTSMTQIDITADTIDTFGGDAIVREVERSGPVTFVAADFLQLEGAPVIGERERTYYRLTQRDGPDRLSVIWKDVQNVDLVRCGDATASSANASADGGSGDAPDETEAPLPIPTGLWVIAGDSCESPANASWRTYDGSGLFGSQSRSCEIVDVSRDSSNRYVIEQTCIATYDGSESTYRDTVEIQAPKRFGLIEDGETEMQDFNWCGPRLRP